MELNLENKVAIVTGASRGIGSAIAKILGAEKMKVVLVARSGGLLEDLAGSMNVECLTFMSDLREPQAAQQTVNAAIQRFGQIDLLVNNAGAAKRGDFLNLTDADWDDGFALKFFGGMRLCRAVWPHLVQSQGSIINIVGVGGRTAKSEFTIGGSVNSALLNLTKALAHRGLADGVRVNAVNPGSIATERLQLRIRNVVTEQGLDYDAASGVLAESLGVASFGRPEDIAKMVAFLASPVSSYCQGCIVDVDGGQTRTL